MPHSRRWITRDEIAGIHDQIVNITHGEMKQNLANKEFDKASDSIDHALEHRQAATDIREIDGLGQYAGQVYSQGRACR